MWDKYVAYMRRKTLENRKIGYKIIFIILLNLIETDFKFQVLALKPVLCTLIYWAQTVRVNSACHEIQARAEKRLWANLVSCVLQSDQFIFFASFKSKDWFVDNCSMNLKRNPLLHKKTSLHSTFVGFFGVEKKTYYKPHLCKQIKKHIARHQATYVSSRLLWK